jgi:outer membrane protein assembly factor BamA
VDYFQSQGYFDAAVDFDEQSPTPGVQRITYAVTRNARHRLVGVEITGNRFFDTATVRERLAVREAGKLRNRYGRYSKKLRDNDRDAILDLYRSNGFRDVQVAATTLDDYRGRTDELGVRYEIEEGVQWTVSELHIEGASPADTAHLREIVQSAAGQPFSEANIAADRDAILSYFFDSGYPDTTFDWSQTPSSVPNHADLHYNIKPGERQFVRDVLVRGLETTRSNVVSSRILIRATRSRKGASRKPSRSCITWAFFPKCRRRCKIPTARKKASTSYSSWTRLLNIPSMSESARSWRGLAGVWKISTVRRAPPASARALPPASAA